MKTEQRLPLWVWVVGPAVVVIVAVVLLAFSRDQGTEESDAGVTFEEVSEVPSRYFGETVTVMGDVAQILGPRSFLIHQRLEGDMLVVSSAPLREVGNEPGGAGFSEESLVWVTGEVRRFDLSAIEDRTGVDLDRETLDAYDGTPAIVNASVSLEQPEEAAVEGRADGGG
jgi:hypothetical protein